MHVAAGVKATAALFRSADHQSAGLTGVIGHDASASQYQRVSEALCRQPAPAVAKYVLRFACGRLVQCDRDDAVRVGRRAALPFAGRVRLEPVQPDARRRCTRVRLRRDRER